MEMRRKDRALTAEETREVIDKGEFGTLSTVSPEGIPYGTPMNYVYDGEYIYMHCSPAEGHKLTNIKHNNNACFSIVYTTELQPAQYSTKYRSAILFGKCVLVDNEEEKRKGLEMIVRKYSPDFIPGGLDYIARDGHKPGMIRFEIESMTGKGKK